MPFHIVALFLSLTNGSQRIMLRNNPSVENGGGKLGEREDYECYDRDQVGKHFLESVVFTHLAKTLRV